MIKETVIQNFLKKGFLVNSEFLNNFNLDEDLNILENKFESKNKPLVLNADLLSVVKQPNSNTKINWFEFERAKVSLEKGRDDKLYSVFLDLLNGKVPEKQKNGHLKNANGFETEIHIEKNGIFPNVTILKSYKEEGKKREVQDFVSYFRVRYSALKKILQNRQELQDVVSISKVRTKKEKGNIVIIGLVYEKRTTKNGNILLLLEDPTGFLNVLIHKNNKELFELAKDIVLDEVIGVAGVDGNDILFARNILLPDIPSSKELKKSHDEVYAVFTADLHIGSNMFFQEDFLKFIEWINGKSGNSKQREIAKKVNYLFILGDLIDGVGIFPDQDKELIIKDVYKQYEKCAELLSKIRKDIKIIIAAGNHDALRIAEPQPVISKKLAKSLWELPNAVMVTNPSLVNIQSSKNFPGFNVLLYHGYSFQYFADNVDNIRLNGGSDRADLIMKFLLQRRHLAPTHSSTLYIPDPGADPLVIDKVPDFFVTAHIHRTTAVNYRNVTLIGCGCWQGQTPFMEKMGVHPDPSRIILTNLRTREIKILKFGK